MTKEEAYDTEINPLMAKIIELCRAHKIDFVASFELGDDLRCTSAIITKDAHPTLAKALSILKPATAFLVEAAAPKPVAEA